MLKINLTGISIILAIISITLWCIGFYYNINQGKNILEIKQTIKKINRPVWIIWSLLILIFGTIITGIIVICKKLKLRKGE